jgi:hypothetical protein
MSKQEIINNFFKEVYPEMTELAMASSDGISCLKDATEYIQELKSQNQSLKAQLQIAVKALTEIIEVGHNPALSIADKALDEIGEVK